MLIWTLVKKELRLLLRDRRAAFLLLVMPVLFIFILGLLLGEGFGQKPDDHSRIMIVDLDRGKGQVRGQSWAEVVREDLRVTGNLRIEKLETREEAEQLIRDHRRAAVLIFDPKFSDRINRCSFLADGINPFYGDGVNLEEIDAVLLKDETQHPGQAAILESVSQKSLVQVILPFMISRAFSKLSEREFIDQLGENVRLPVPETVTIPEQRRILFRLAGVKLDDEGRVRFADLLGLAGIELKLDEKSHAKLNDLLELAAQKDGKKMDTYRDKVGEGVKTSLAQQFKNYDLTGMTWDKLTKSKEPRQHAPAEEKEYVNKGGNGPLHRGAFRYQLLVPSYTVLFSFFIVMTVGWLFVGERRHGTLKRLHAAPIGKWQILLGKLLPCLVLSVGQGVILLIAGKLLFGMRWGPESWPLVQQALWLFPVVITTSIAAVGLAMLVAVLARTEAQVALYGAVPVLVLALIGGCVLPREMMPEQTQQLTLLSPLGWALDAYRELLLADGASIPNPEIVIRACAVLALFGVGFVTLAWWALRLE